MKKNIINSIIIPSWSGNAEKITSEIKKQNINDYEIIIIKGVNKPSLARNIGAQKAKGVNLFFIDDDIVFEGNKVLNSLMSTVRNEKTGAVSAGLLLPKDATWFQKRFAKEIDRTEIISNKSDEDKRDLLTGICFIIKKSLFNEVGGFDEKYISGEDREFFYRLSKKGYSNHILADHNVYHYPPSNIIRTVHKFYWYGIGHFQSSFYHPEWNIGPQINNNFKAIFYFIIRTLFLPIHIFVDLRYGSKKIKLGFHPIRAIASYSAVIGYIKGFFYEKIKLRKNGETI